MLQAAKVWINGDNILRVSLSISRKDTIDQEEDKKVEGEKKEASSHKNTS